MYTNREESVVLTYYDIGRGRYVDKMRNKIRKDVTLSFFYYDFNDRTIKKLNLSKGSIKRYTSNYVENNFRHASEIKNIETFGRILKLKKIMKEING